MHVTPVVCHCIYHLQQIRSVESLWADHWLSQDSCSDSHHKLNTATVFSTSTEQLCRTSVHHRLKCWNYRGPGRHAPNAIVAPPNRWEKTGVRGTAVCAPSPIDLLLSETRAIKAQVHLLLSISVLSSIATGRLQRQTAAAQLLAL